MKNASIRPRDLRLRHPEGLVPQAGLLVAEAPAGPFHGAQRGGEPHFELVAVGVGDERLTGGAARGDLVHVALAVGVGEEVEYSRSRMVDLSSRAAG